MALSCQINPQQGVFEMTHSQSIDQIIKSLKVTLLLDESREALQRFVEDIVESKPPISEAVNEARAMATFLRVKELACIILDAKVIDAYPTESGMRILVQFGLNRIELSVLYKNIKVKIISGLPVEPQ